MNDYIPAENQKFSTGRFLMLLRSEMRINKRKYLRMVLATLGCFLTLAILVSVFAITDINSLEDRGLEQFIYSSKRQHVSYYQMASLFIVSIGMTVLGSLTFISMNSKGGRISTLMTPASMLEKFTLRFIIYFIGSILIMLVGYCIGLLELWATFSDFKDVLFVDPVEDSEVIKGILILLGLPILCGCSFYALGSSIWPRSSWVKTWVVQQIFGIVAILAASFGFFNSMSAIVRWVAMHEANDDLIMWIFIAVNVILISLCWGLAWWRFRNTQIIQRFMNN